MDNQDKHALLPNLLPWVVVIFAVVLVVLYAVVFRALPPNESPGAWGQFGDYLGGILNPLVSTLTLFVAVRVWQLQKDELVATRALVDEQNLTAERQRQEQRFFDLLNTYYRVVDSLRFDPPSTDKSFSGKESIRVWLSAYALLGEFVQPYGRYVVSEDKIGASKANKPLIEQLRLEWCGEASKIPDRFGPYLRTVDKILATANLVLSTHKLEYLHLFRAQLSNSELALIGYQVLLGPADSELQRNVEQFGLLATLRPGDLRSALADRLPASAFRYPVDESKEATPC